MTMIGIVTFSDSRVPQKTEYCTSIGLVGDKITTLSIMMLGGKSFSLNDIRVPEETSRE